MPDTIKVNFSGAANAALHRLLKEMPETLVYGEDVAEPGGVFGVSRGLRKRFGDRVFDTPISESAILGSAIGAAIMGRRPIVEIMWVDFSLVALDQLVNQAANIRYTSNGSLAAPITVRTQQGSMPGACAQHSQNLEAFFVHTPGLRVAMPSTPQDAYDLLLAAAHCDDPTIVIENRNLYFGAKEDVSVGGPVQGIGDAATRREGDDVTLVSWGAMTHQVLEAAEQLKTEDVNAEVIELRWLAPMDIDRVLDSVRRTGRLLIAHEANVTGGVGAEITAKAHEHAFADLVAPVVRIGVPDARMPAAPSLRDELVPDTGSIVTAARALLTHDE